MLSLAGPLAPFSRVIPAFACSSIHSMQLTYALVARWLPLRFDTFGLVRNCNDVADIQKHMFELWQVQKFRKYFFVKVGNSINRFFHLSKNYRSAPSLASRHSSLRCFRLARSVSSYHDTFQPDHTHTLHREACRIRAIAMSEQTFGLFVMCKTFLECARTTRSRSTWL